MIFPWRLCLLALAFATLQYLSSFHHQLSQFRARAFIKHYQHLPICRRITGDLYYRRGDGKYYKIFATSLNETYLDERSDHLFCSYPLCMEGHAIDLS